jgi:hypothetical protein
MQKGFKMTDKSREKMRIAAFTRDNSARIAALPRGKKHWAWAVNPSILALHKRIHRRFGKASNKKCIDCNKKAHDWSSNTGKYSSKITDYSPRCRSCHVKKDKNWIKKYYDKKTKVHVVHVRQLAGAELDIAGL